MRTMLLFVLLSIFPAIAFGRVFNFNTEAAGAYFRGGMGLSRAGTESFRYAGAVNESFDKEHTYNYAGEIGFIFSAQGRLSFRVGAEIEQSKVSNIEASSSGGTKLYNLTSDIFMFNPSATFEYHWLRGASHRLSIFGGAGYSSFSVDQTYSFAAGGLSKYPSVADYVEKMEATAISAHYGVIYEFLLADTTTMALEMGFRHLNVSQFKYKGDIANTMQGNVSKGDVVLNAGGDPRRLDFGGFYIALSFRFWIDVL